MRLCRLPLSPPKQHRNPPPKSLNRTSRLLSNPPLSRLFSQSLLRSRLLSRNQSLSPNRSCKPLLNRVLSSLRNRLLRLSPSQRYSQSPSRSLVPLFKLPIPHNRQCNPSLRPLRRQSLNRVRNLWQSQRRSRSRNPLPDPPPNRSKTHGPVST